MQERILATRVLHFTKGELFWECYSEHCCETYPQYMDPRTLEGAIPKDLPTSIYSSPNGTWGDAENPWQTIILAYSAAKLTKHEDKEAAIYGIIDALSRKASIIHVLQDYGRTHFSANSSGRQVAGRKINTLFSVDISNLSGQWVT
jgi:hypothetical protein